MSEDILEENLKGKTKKELTEIRRRFEIPGISHLNKAELRRAIAEKLPDHLDSWLENTTNMIYEQLDGLIEEGNIAAEERKNMEFIYEEFSRLGLVIREGSGQIVYTMPEHLRKSFRKTIDDDLLKQIENNTQFILKLGTRMYFYGLQNYKRVYNLMDDHFDQKGSVGHGKKVLNEHLNFFDDLRQVQIDRESYLYHASIDELYGEIDTPEDLLTLRREGLDFKPLSSQEKEYFIDEGDFPWRAARKIRDEFLQDNLDSDDLIKMTIDRLFHQFNLGGHPRALSDSLKSFLMSAGDVRPEDIEEKKIKELVEEFTLEAHCWVLKGHTLASQNEDWQSVFMEPEISPGDLVDSGEGDDFGDELISELASMLFDEEIKPELDAEIKKMMSGESDKELSITNIEKVMLEKMRDLKEKVFGHTKLSEDIFPAVEDSLEERKLISVSDWSEDFSRRITREINPDWSLEECLEALTVDELDRIRRSHDISGISNLNKAEKVQALNWHLLRAMDELIIDLNYPLQNYLEDLINHGGAVNISERGRDFDPENPVNLIMYKYLQDRGVAFIGEHQGDIIHVMPPRIRNRLKELLKKDVKDLGRKNSYLLQLSLGLLIYYGICDKVKLYEIITEKYEVEKKLRGRVTKWDYFSVMDEAVEYGALIDGYYLDRVYGRSSDIEYYACAYLLFPEEVLVERSKREGISFYVPSEEDVFFAAQNSLPREALKQNFEEFFHQKGLQINKEIAAKKGVDTGDEFSINRYLYNMINNNYDIQEVIGELEEIVNEVEEDDFMELVKQLQNFNNSIPHWILKGRTPNEVQGNNESSFDL